MQAVLDFLKECGTFYLATVEGDQPRVRPFGAVIIFEGKMYICTNKTKAVSAQMKNNAKVEISGTVQGDWLRLTASAVLDDNRAARQAMLDAYPGLKNMYSADDGIYEVYAIENASAVIKSFAGRNDCYEF